ncbi:hypothetical protein CC80DRAFT_492851 [Byssothecium circinans]|uniref:Uncharacterized protein n=1 Tax=Byssothecium circinans TaxID=147558 RepID=A0A6A5TV60_9PLEO|nr:hypothetical protein CC80DRAFT_492851 [Byssothecium circinans]
MVVKQTAASNPTDKTTHTLEDMEQYALENFLESWELASNLSAWDFVDVDDKVFGTLYVKGVVVGKTMYRGTWMNVIAYITSDGSIRYYRENNTSRSNYEQNLIHFMFPLPPNHMRGHHRLRYHNALITAIMVKAGNIARFGEIDGITFHRLGVIVGWTRNLLPAEKPTASSKQAMNGEAMENEDTETNDTDDEEDVTCDKVGNELVATIRVRPTFGPRGDVPGAQDFV